MKLHRSLLLVAALATVPLHAQDDNVRIHGQATDRTTGKVLRAYTVTVTDTLDSTVRWTAPVDLKGRYELKLPYDRVYRVEMSAPDHWSKYVIVDVHDVAADMRRAGFSLFIELELVRPFPIGDPTLLERPMGIAAYSPKKRNMVWDEAYSKRMRMRWEAEKERMKAPPPGP